MGCSSQQKVEGEDVEERPTAVQPTVPSNTQHTRLQRAGFEPKSLNLLRPNNIVDGYQAQSGLPHEQYKRVTHSNTKTKSNQIHHQEMHERAESEDFIGINVDNSLPQYYQKLESANRLMSSYENNQGMAQQGSPPVSRREQEVQDLLKSRWQVKERIRKNEIEISQLMDAMVELQTDITKLTSEMRQYQEDNDRIRKELQFQMEKREKLKEIMRNQQIYQNSASSGKLQDLGNRGDDVEMASVYLKSDPIVRRRRRLAAETSSPHTPSRDNRTDSLLTRSRLFLEKQRQMRQDLGTGQSDDLKYEDL